MIATNNIPIHQANLNNINNMFINRMILQNI